MMHDQDTIMTLGQWRQARGMTWRGLSAAAHISGQTLARAYRGDRLWAPTMHRIADALDVDIMAIAEFRASILGEEAP